MASGVFYPAVSGDDGHGQDNGLGFFDGEDFIRIGESIATWVRFPTVAIPRGSTITSAYVKLTGQALIWDSVYLKVSCFDADNPSAPIDGAGVVTQIAGLTSAQVDWDTGPWFDGTQYDTSSLVVVIQEIIDRPGWSSGNALIVYITDDGCGTSDSVKASSIDYLAGAEKPELRVEWTPSNLTESVVITSPPNVRELINRIAYEASSIEYWDAGAHNIIYLPTHTTVSKTIDANRIDAGSVSVDYTDRVDLLNSLVLWYNYYWSGYNGNDAFRETVTDSNDASIAKYGALEKEPFQFKYLEGAQNAERAIRWLLTELKNPRLIVSFTGGYYLTSIRRGALINFDFTDGDELDAAFSGFVSTSDKYMVTDVVRGHGYISIKTVQLVEV